MSRRSSKSGRHFKTLTGDFSQRLLIPPAFVKHIDMDASQTAKLKIPNGRNWRVQLSKMVTGTYLQDGWPEFVRDNFLKDFDLLLFRYDGNRRFTVRIFYKTACEREELITCNTHQETASCSGMTHLSSKKTCSDFGPHSQLFYLEGAETTSRTTAQILRCNNTDSSRRVGSADSIRLI